MFVFRVFFILGICHGQYKGFQLLGSRTKKWVIESKIKIKNLQTDQTVL